MKKVHFIMNLEEIECINQVGNMEDGQVDTMEDGKADNMVAEDVNYH